VNGPRSSAHAAERVRGLSIEMYGDGGADIFGGQGCSQGLVDEAAFGDVLFLNACPEGAFGCLQQRYQAELPPSALLGRR
jgi:hypothetical protein